MKNLKVKMLLATITAAAMLTACGKADIQLNNETVTVELGTELSGEITDYITIDNEAELENVALDVSGVNTDAVGAYTASVTYGDEVFDINVNVVDTTAPVINTSDKDVTVGDIVKVSDVADASDLADVELTFEDGSNTWTADAAGNYSLVVKAVDVNGNESMATVKVVVNEPEPEVAEEPEAEEIVTGTVDNDTASNTSGTGKTDTKGNNSSNASNGSNNGASNSSTGNSNGSGNAQAQDPEPSAPQQQAPASNPEPAPTPAPDPAPSNPSGGATSTPGTDQDMKYAQDMLDGTIVTITPTEPAGDLVLPDDFGDDR